MEKVYCQSCGEDLTNREGLVGNNSKVYCFGDCFYQDLNANLPTILDFKRMNSDGIQQEIRMGRLTHFSPLEYFASQIKR